MANNITHSGVNTYVSTDVLHQFEPTLSGYYPTGYTSWSVQVALALRELIQDLKKLSKKVKLFCTPLTLQAEITATGNMTGTATTSEDVVERMMFVINCTGAGTFTLYGSNDNTTFVQVTSLTTALTSATTLNTMFTTPYKYYRLDYTGSGSVYSGYLVETSFFLAHSYLSLALVYQLLSDNSDDFWKQKFQYYMDKYQYEMTNLVASYDESEDGVIDEGEENLTIKVVRLVH